MRTESVALVLVLAVVSAGSPAQVPAPPLDDPRPNGRLSMRELSLCEPPETPDRSDWCTYPHEVRRFIDDRDACDHFRGEPWPEADDAEGRQRRAQLTQGMRATCTGTDDRLTDLLRRYATDPDVMSVLRGYDRKVESGKP